MKYADYALREIPGAVFTLFDPRSAKYRPLRPDAAKAVIAGTLKPEMSMMRDPVFIKKRTIDSIPRPLHPAYWWITKSRRKLIEVLEDRRIGAASDKQRERWDRLQRRLISPKMHGLHYDPSNQRIDRPSLNSILGPPIELTREDTTLAMQSDWVHTDIEETARAHRLSGSRHVVMCHDVIPILYPDWFKQNDADLFKRYFDRAFAVADRVTFTTKASEQDARTYCKSIGLTLPDTRVVPLGTDVLSHGRRGDAALPAPLLQGRYALYVSTIEPRKNHRMLLEAWKRLVGQGVVPNAGFKLVLVGRPGWKMGGFLEDLKADDDLRDTVVHLTDISDGTLARLYQDAGFCVFPPLYEGFGLPAVEALAAGKAVIASRAGPIADIVGDFGVCLDPTDVDAWSAKIGEWIADPTERDALSAKAKAQYRPLSWDQSSKLFFEAVLDRKKP